MGQEVHLGSNFGSTHLSTHKSTLSWKSNQFQRHNIQQMTSISLEKNLPLYTLFNISNCICFLFNSAKYALKQCCGWKKNSKSINFLITFQKELTSLQRQALDDIVSSGKPKKIVFMNWSNPINTFVMYFDNFIFMCNPLY